MELVAEWSVRCEPVNIADAANISGYSQAYIRDTYRAGVFAPAPDVRLQVVNLPLHHVFALAVIAEAEKQGISLKQLADVLPVLAGSAYIRFIETEVQAGRCLQHAGIQSLNAKLWHALRSGAARKGLEQRLPGGPVATRRFACFSATSHVACDDLSEVGEELGAYRVVDSWVTLTHVNKVVRGTFFRTVIN